MMKATGLKHLLRSIRKSGVYFLAVAVIAGVSIAIFQGFQSSAHRALRVAGGAEILEIHQPAGAVCKDQVGTGGAHVDAQGATLRRDSAGGRGIRYKDLGAVLQGRTAAQAVPRV